MSYNIVLYFFYYYLLTAPTPSVSLISLSSHFPNQPNYNQITFNCTCTVPLLFNVDLEFDKVFVWTVDNVDVTSSATTPSNPRAATSLSILTQTFSSAGQYEISCRVNINVTGDPVVSSINNTVISITGKIVSPLSCTISFLITLTVTPFYSKCPTLYILNMCCCFFCKVCNSCLIVFRLAVSNGPSE